MSQQAPWSVEVESGGHPVALLIPLLLLDGLEKASLPAGEPSHHKEVPLEQTDPKVPAQSGQERAQPLTLELDEGFQQRFDAGL